MGPPCGVGGRLGYFFIHFKSFTQEARTRTHTLWSQASKRKKSKTKRPPEGERHKLKQTLKAYAVRRRVCRSAAKSVRDGQTSTGSLGHSATNTGPFRSSNDVRAGRALAKDRSISIRPINTSTDLEALSGSANCTSQTELVVCPGWSDQHGWPCQSVLSAWRNSMRPVLAIPPFARSIPALI